MKILQKKSNDIDQGNGKEKIIETYIMSSKN